jgi:segregation and condensation protein A
MAETPQSSPVDSDSLVLHLQGFEGPLDLLLDLARQQKLDLATISILALVDQFLAVIEGARRVRLELAADWLVMAAWLAWLKSRLLLPASDQASEEGEIAAEALAARLRDLARVRQLAEWLNTHPQLGQDVFVRGAPEDLTEADRSRIALDMGGLMRSLLAATRRANAFRVYRPRPAALWSVQDALARLGAMLGHLPDWSDLEQYLPDGLTTALERRGAMASSLIAGLEMARSGHLHLRQDQAFGPILLYNAQTAEETYDRAG